MIDPSKAIDIIVMKMVRRKVGAHNLNQMRGIMDKSYTLSKGTDPNTLHHCDENG